MFTRSIFETPDMIEQHNLLDEVSRLIDQGVLRTTLAENLSRINAANLKRAHAMVESGKSRGKLVLEGVLTRRTESTRISIVVPVKAGTQGQATKRSPWAPAFAGATAVYLKIARPCRAASPP